VLLGDRMQLNAPFKPRIPAMPDFPLCDTSSGERMAYTNPTRSKSICVDGMVRLVRLDVKAVP
jgi:hypothetical protein